STVLPPVCDCATVDLVPYPYTTLFRSRAQIFGHGRLPLGRAAVGRENARGDVGEDRSRGCRIIELAPGFALERLGLGPAGHVVRSEEHTSELQSREKLVCRLLLEKKKK